MKKALADAIERRGYTTLTPVQTAVTDAELTGKDLLVSAQTGSGKTLGFGLAIAPTLLGEDEKFGQAAAPLALVIAPTRELAMQVKRELTWLYEDTGAFLASCVGGMDMRDERRALGRGAHIVVATPGRLRDHIMRGSIDLSQIRAVILDEADEMLDLGFREDLEFILGESPETRQTLLFSATVPRAIANLAKSYQNDAVRVSTTAEKSQHTDIEYRAMAVSARDGESAIINTLRYFEAPNAIVFCNTRAMVNRITTRLSNRGFSVVALSGELSQNERTHALQAMRDGRARVCVATDVAARGIDLPNLDLVIHAELPSNHETLLHRSGRTGRAGRKGVSALIVPPASRKKAERILRSAKLTAEWAEAPSAEDVAGRDQERMLEDPDWHTDIPDSQKAAVNQLVAQFSPEQIAAAFLRQYASRHTAPEELSAIDAKPKPRAPFGPSVWFSISGGRAAGAEPRRLLPMLCKAGGISKDDIGAIRIGQDESYVELQQSSVDGFMQQIGENMRVEEGTLTKLDKAPDIANSPRPAYSPKPRSPKPPYKKSDGPKSDYKKPDYKKSDGSKSDYKKSDYKKSDYKKHDDAKPAYKKPSTPGTTKPVEWNDEPTKREKKPKSTGAPKSKTKKPYKAQDNTRDGAVEAATPKRKPDNSKFARSDFSGRKKPGSTPKGTPTPKGKPSSKKNRARQAAAKTAGGTQPPRRGKS